MRWLYVTEEYNVKKSNQAKTASVAATVLARSLFCVILLPVFSVCFSQAQPLHATLDRITLPPAFPSGSYTPHGYLDNPYHSMVFNRSGVIRSVPPTGFGWWRADFKGNYGGGVRDHQNYFSILQMSVVIDGASFVGVEDFGKAGVRLSSSYHTKNMMSYDWRYKAVEVSLKYFLPRENSLVCLVELTNTGDDTKRVFLHVTHIYKIGDVKWWGSNGIAANYSEQVDAAVSKIWAYGDAFALGADVKSIAHKATDSERQWEQWMRTNDTSSLRSFSITGRGPLHSILSYDITLPGKSDRSFLICLSRDRNELWAKRELQAGLTESRPILERQLSEDQKFWSSSPMLAGDWPDTWKHGWVYDFETLRMNVRRPIGIFKHPWDAMQVHSPRVVLGETSLDMMTLSYVDPALAKEVIYGTFADALAPNVPCSREDGSVNMISSDGSECGTAPMWGFPFHAIKSMYASTLDSAWIRKLYPYLKNYIEWWLQNRTDKEGWLHCNNSWESGQDGSKRFIVAEGNEGAVADFVRTVDVEASMAEAMQNMISFAEIAEKKEDQSHWKQLAERRIKNTRAMFYDGWFRDVDARNNRPIILQEYHDVMMLTPLTCKVATQEQVRQVKPMFHYFASSRKLEWPPGIFAFTEAAWNAGERVIASDVVAETADRVYARTDSKTLLFADSALSYRIPGVANEFWPSRFIPAGGENYGWGATLPMDIIRNIVGFREPDDSFAKEFFLAPAIPTSLLKPGKKYVTKNLRYREFTFDVTYEVRESNKLKISVSYSSPQPLSTIVHAANNTVLFQQKGKKSRDIVSFDGTNSNVYVMSFK